MMRYVFICGFLLASNACVGVYSGRNILPYKPLHEAKSIIDAQLKEDLEAHEVETEDGYILTVHRLPGPPGSLPIYIQHGYLLNSICWLIPGKNKALPYILWEAGYDVWLGNVRGSTFSRKHKTLSTSESKFWDFAWDEYGYYDAPAIVNYISDFRNSSLFYIGHSMGGPILSIMSIERPEVAKKIEAAILLAPAIYANHRTSLLRFLVPLKSTIMGISNLLGINEFFSRSFFFNFIANTICHISSNVCAYLIFLTDGANFKQLNQTLLPDIFNNFPAGSSMRAFNGFLQAMSYAEFQKYDFGPTENLKKYGSETPPLYDISKVEVPVAAFWSNNDNLCVKRDIYRAYEKLPKKLGIFGIDDKLFNHYDYLWANDAPKLLYKKILQMLREVKSKSFESSQQKCDIVNQISK